MNFQKILKLIFLLLIIENGIFYIAVFSQGTNNTIFHTLMYFDIICYFLLGIFLILQGLVSEVGEFIVAGITFLFWDGVTLVWRTTLNFYSDVVQTNNADTFSQTLNTVINYYLLAGIAFVIGIYFLSKGMQLENRDKIMVNAYGVINLVSVILTLQIIGLIPKLLLVPLLGIITYSILAKNIGVKFFST